MGQIRTLLMRNRALAALVLALALAMKALVPAGFMVGAAEQALTIEICDGHAAGSTLSVAIPMKEQSGDPAHERAAKECPFTALSMHALSGADPIVLALALAFILTLGFAPVQAVRIARPGYLTPPLRGPPALS